MPIALAIFSGFFHSLWNLFAKRSFNKEAFLFNIQIFSLILYSPWAIKLLMHTAWTTKLVTLLALSMVIHGTYFVLLARAYTHGDLSQVYPIVRGSSSLIVPLAGVFLIHEHLTTVGWIAAIAVAFGIFLLGDFRKKTSSKKTVLLAIALGGCVASYIVVDKMALTFVSSILVNWFGTLGNLMALHRFIPKRTRRNEWHKNTGFIVAGSLAASGSYLIFLTAIRQGAVAQLSPIREIGTVFGVIFGIFLLKEPRGSLRFFASCLVTVGIILLSIFH